MSHKESDGFVSHYKAELFSLTPSGPVVCARNVCLGLQFGHLGGGFWHHTVQLNFAQPLKHHSPGRKLKYCATLADHQQSLNAGWLMVINSVGSEVKESERAEMSKEIPQLVGVLSVTLTLTTHSVHRKWHWRQQWGKIQDICKDKKIIYIYKKIHIYIYTYKSKD